MGVRVQSRADRDPPAQWWASVLAALRVRFPRADLQQSAVVALRPHLAEHWRRGLSPNAAAQTVFSCDGKRLESGKPVSDVPAVRAPKGAKADQVFGVEELRDPAKIAAMEGKATRLEAKLAAAVAKRKAKEVFHKDASKEAAAESSLRTEIGELRQAITTARKAPITPRSSKPRAAAGCPPHLEACKIGFLGGVCGLPAPLVLAAAQGSPVVRDARFCLTSVWRLIPSHVPQRGFAPNSSYPLEVQERAYDRDKGEQLKVLSIAQNMIPELIFNGAPGAIDGLPVVTPSGIVLGGNGRTMALQLHYADHGEVARAYLLEHARQFGFSRAQVEATASPVVVRVIETSEMKAELQKLVRLLNVPLLKSLDARSESVAEARRLSDEVLDVLSVALDGDLSLAQYLSTPASRTLAGALRRSEILTDLNAARLLVPGGDRFSEDGKRFVERLLLASLIPDAQLLDQLDGRIRESLARSAPWWLSAAAGGEDWDARPALTAAARDLVSMHREDAKSVDAYLRQIRMGEPAAVINVPLGEKLLRLLDDVGTRPTALMRIAKDYARLSRFHPSSQGSLLAEEKITAAQALDRAAQSL